jgi:hypothetical protein
MFPAGGMARQLSHPCFGIYGDTKNSAVWFAKTSVASISLPTLTIIMLGLSRLRRRLNKPGGSLEMVVAVAVAVMVAMTYPCRAATERISSVPTREDIQEANRRLPNILLGQPDLLEHATVVATLENKLVWSSLAPNAWLLLPVRIRFRGNANSYCRLATASEGVKNILLVHVPAHVNFDDCSGVSDLRYMEINGDGTQDLVEGVLVKSNVSSVQVVIPLVYLSSPTAKSGYCYSEAASCQLAPADLKSDASAKKVLERAEKRLGMAVLTCASL